MIDLYYLNHSFKARGKEYYNDYICQKCNCFMYCDVNFGEPIYYFIDKINDRIKGFLLINCDEYIIKSIIE